MVLSQVSQQLNEIIVKDYYDTVLHGIDTTAHSRHEVQTKKVFWVAVRYIFFIYRYVNSHSLRKKNNVKDVLVHFYISTCTMDTMVFFKNVYRSSVGVNTKKRGRNGIKRVDVLTANEPSLFYLNFVFNGFCRCFSSYPIGSKVEFRLPCRLALARKACFRYF